MTEIILTMLNGDEIPTLVKGGIANARRWAKAYLKNQDIVRVEIPIIEDGMLMMPEVYEDRRFLWNGC
jgi:hypothetical protein